MADEMKKYVVELEKVSIVGDDYYIFDFKIPKGITFKEGQYGVFVHVDKEIEGRKVRAFSIASSNNEDVFKIATKIIENPSDFKIKMRELKIGDTMTFNGPMGSFILKEDFHSVFIAGGIGITPIRGILKQIEELSYNKESVLIYSEPRNVYPFKEEFDNMYFLDKHYKNNVENTQEAIVLALDKYANKAYYYIAGSPRFVGGIKEQLMNNGIGEKNIKFDRFSGY